MNNAVLYQQTLCGKSDLDCIERFNRCILNKTHCLMADIRSLQNSGQEFGMSAAIELGAYINYNMDGSFTGYRIDYYCVMDGLCYQNY